MDQDARVVEGVDDDHAAKARRREIMAARRAERVAQKEAAEPALTPTQLRARTIQSAVAARMRALVQVVADELGVPVFETLFAASDALGRKIDRERLAVGFQIADPEAGSVDESCAALKRPIRRHVEARREDNDDVVLISLVHVEVEPQRGPWRVSITVDAGTGAVKPEARERRKPANKRARGARVMEKPRDAVARNLDKLSDTEADEMLAKLQKRRGKAEPPDDEAANDDAPSTDEPTT